MKKTKVKICGITNLEDAIVAVGAGCDALGFIFYKKSPRFISPLAARKIIRLLPKRIIKIGIFVDASLKSIKSIARSCKLDILQFHGNESAEFCKKFKGFRIIKAFHVKNKINPRDLKKYDVFAYLFDTFSSSKLGGTGKQFNWSWISDVNRVGKPVFLSGGLNEINVGKAIRSVHPQWVDASSSLEASPGKKDKIKVIRFIKKAKQH